MNCCEVLLNNNIITHMDSHIVNLLNQRKKISDAESYIDSEIVIAGWIVFSRSQKKRIFLKRTDSRKSKLFPIQVLFNRNEDTEQYLTELLHVSAGFSIVIKGKIVTSPASGQKIEMIGDTYHILGRVHDPSTFPLAKSELTIDYIRSIRHLGCHIPVISTVLSIRSELMSATEKFFELKDYTKCDMPLITFSECEGGCQPMQTTMFLSSGKLIDIPIKKQKEKSEEKLVDFSKDFFGSRAFLTVSGQLELETQLPQGDVWTVTRAVRGEPSQTSRHLSEFSMIEIEKAFSTSSLDIIDISIEYIKYCISYVIKNCLIELQFLEKKLNKNIVSKLENYLTVNFPIITHVQAIDILLQHSEKFSVTPNYTDDLASEHEKFLTDEHFNVPVVITRYPKQVKAFYMPVVTETQEESHGIEHVDCFDILVPDVGELVGGSQRIHNYEELIDRIKELNLDSTSLNFYTDLRKMGSIPHGGMGLGFERLVKFITNVDNVKDCVSFPRYIGCEK